jgi:hypothetical protein
MTFPQLGKVRRVPRSGRPFQYEGNTYIYLGHRMYDNTWDHLAVKMGDYLALVTFDSLNGAEWL